MFSQACVKNSVHSGGGDMCGRGVMHGWGMGGCVARGICGRGVCMAGGMHDGGCAWQGVCTAEGGMYGREHV